MGINNQQHNNLVKSIQSFFFFLISKGYALKRQNAAKHTGSIQGS